MRLKLLIGMIIHNEIIPASMISAFSVQPVLNFGKRIAAEISSGSSIIPPKRFWRPCWIALMSGRHILVDASCLLSFDCNSKITGSSHPKCVLVSDWRMFKAFTTGLITEQNSFRKAISAWLNLCKINKTHKTVNKLLTMIWIVQPHTTKYTLESASLSTDHEIWQMLTYKLG